MYDLFLEAESLSVFYPTELWERQTAGFLFVLCGSGYFEEWYSQQFLGQDDVRQLGHAIEENNALHG